MIHICVDNIMDTFKMMILCSCLQMGKFTIVFIIINVQPNIIEIKCFVGDTFLVQRPQKMVTVVAVIVY